MEPSLRTMDLKLKQSAALAKVIWTKVKVLVLDSIAHCNHYMINEFERASSGTRVWQVLAISSGQQIKNFTLSRKQLQGQENLKKICENFITQRSSET